MLEKDIETAFCKWIVMETGGEIFGRQVHLPMGIADVMGASGSTPFVAEIKLGVIDDHACTQLMGYLGQLWMMFDSSEGYKINHVTQIPYTIAHCLGYLVGTDVTARVRRVLATHRVHFVQYSVLPSGDIHLENRYEYNDGQEFIYDIYHPDAPALDREVLRNMVEAMACSYPRRDDQAKGQED